MKYEIIGEIRFFGKKKNKAKVFCKKTKKEFAIQKVKFPHIFKGQVNLDWVKVEIEKTLEGKDRILSVKKHDGKVLEFKSHSLNTKKINEPSADLPAVHLYLPWSPIYDPEQMHKIKNKIESYGSSWLGKLNVSPGKSSLHPELANIINDQIEQGKETRLYMTDFNSIHVFHIDQVSFNDPEDLSKDLSIIDMYKDPKLLKEFWIKVKDVYVLTVDHNFNKNGIIDELGKLIFLNTDDFTSRKIEGNKNFVTPYVSSKRFPAMIMDSENKDFFQIYTDQECKQQAKWLNSHRRLTKSYFECSQHLNRNVYPEIWNSFSKATQHYLTECQMKLMESASYTSTQAFRILFQAWDSYFLAVTNEIHKYFYEEFSIKDRQNLKNIFNGMLDEYDFNINEVFKFSNETLRNPKDWNLIKSSFRFSGNNESTQNFVTIVENLRDKGSPLNSLLWEIKGIRNNLQHEIKMIYKLKSSNKRSFNEILKVLRLHLNLVTSPNSNANIFFNLAITLGKVDKKAFPLSPITAKDCNREISRLMNSYKETGT